MSRILQAMALSVLVAAPCSAQWTSARPDGHAPIGIMGDHAHGKGEVMVSYRYMAMGMTGNRVGSLRVGDDEVLDAGAYDYRIAPQRMPMQMHMVGLMYAPTADITLMTMLAAVSLEMDHVTRSGGAFSTQSSGIGDVQVGAMWTVARFGRERIHLNAAVSLPTGSIDASDVTPASAPNEAVLPYPMQIGSGTFDLQAGATYLGQVEDWSWGGQALATIRLGENERGYRLGNRAMVVGWGSRVLSRAISASVMLGADSWGDIHGTDPVFDGAVAMRMVHTVDPLLRGGSRIEAGVGANVYPRGSTLPGVRFAVDFRFPFYQDLDGPQLESDWRLVAGVQYAF